MATIKDPMKEKITLHGLGFIQVQLGGGQRLHVWHPDLPRRHCFRYSAIHNHRFSFESRILVGEMENINYEIVSRGTGELMTYSHEGPRMAGGGRPWTPDGQIGLVECSAVELHPGESYRMGAYDFHKTIPLGDGKVATLMRKLDEGEKGAHSTCSLGVTPDAHFDRFQWPPHKLWEFVTDVVGGL